MAAQLDVDAAPGARIAIIGGGFSGAALAAELMRGGYAFRSLTIIESTGEIGRGLAYATECAAHLLNSRAPSMSVVSARDDFVGWLAARDAAQQTFPGRSVYGDYIAERFRNAHSRCSGDVRIVRARATSLTKGDAVHVTLDNGARIDADIVVLATGHQAPVAPGLFEAAGLEEDIFLRNPWKPGAYSSIRADEDVLLLGTGMTMVDAVLALSPHERRGRIFAISRRGLIPRTHEPKSRDAAPPIALPTRLSAALHELRRQARSATAAGRSYRDLIDELRPNLPAIWRSLSLDEQRRFLRHARPWWDVHRHKLAPSIAERLDHLQRTGALVVLAGKVSAVSASNAQVRVEYTPRGGGQGALQVSRIINCTGPSADPRASRDPLMQSLLSAGLARAHATGLGLDVNDHGALIDACGVASSRVFALGPLTQGAFWECVAAPEIRSRAVEMAKIIAPATQAGLSPDRGA